MQNMQQYMIKLIKFLSEMVRHLCFEQYTETRSINSIHEIENVKILSYFSTLRKILNISHQKTNNLLLVRLDDVITASRGHVGNGYKSTDLD